MKNIYASIVTIGDELLIGQVIDTNSAWIAQQLNRIGIAVRNRVAIGDDAEEIKNTLTFENENTSVVLITGGLGPTNDDITKQVLCEYFSAKMVVDQKALENVTYLFEQVYHKPVSEVNLRQAEVPDVCEVIQNKRGSAPGMVFHKKGTIFISMPGVPYEMMGMMEDVLLYLQNHFELPVILHKTILTTGIGESALAAHINDFEDNLPKEIKLAYLPNHGMVRLRLTTTGFDKVKTEKAINSQFAELKKRVGQYMVADNDESMQEVVGKILLQNKKTMATAESCTGGAIASLITSVPGSSQYFEGSIVSYSNRIKETLLGVASETLEKFGAVSEETVREMLSGLLTKMGTDYGIAVSGIMGPSGGTAAKPVGTVWVAAGSRDAQLVRMFKQRFQRTKNIEVTAVMALNLLRTFLISEGSGDNKES